MKYIEYLQQLEALRTQYDAGSISRKEFAQRAADLRRAYEYAASQRDRARRNEKGSTYLGPFSPPSHKA